MTQQHQGPQGQQGTSTNPGHELFQRMASLLPQAATLSAQSGGRDNVRSLTAEVAQFAQRVFDELGVDVEAIEPSRFLQIWEAQLGDQQAAVIADRFTTFCRNPQRYISQQAESKIRMKLGTAVQELRTILAQNKVIARATTPVHEYATAGMQSASTEARHGEGDRR